MNKNEPISMVWEQREYIQIDDYNVLQIILILHTLIMGY